MSDMLGQGEAYIEECYGSGDYDENRDGASYTIRARAIGYKTVAGVLAAYIHWEEDNGKTRIYNMERGKISVKRIEGAWAGAKELRGKWHEDCWEIECEHSTKEKYFNAEYADVSFTTTCETEHITRSLGTKRAIPCEPGYSPVDYDGGIGYNGENYEGTDVIRPTITLTQDRMISCDVVTDAWMAQMAALSGRINDRTWRGFKPGDVLFTGITNASLQRLSLKDGGYFPYWKVTYEFKIRFSMLDVTVGSSVPFDKPGWDCLWVLNKKRKISGSVVDVPVQANIEQVYPTANFSDFGVPAIEDLFSDNTYDFAEGE